VNYVNDITDVEKTMDSGSGFKGYKTFIVNGAIALLPLIDFLANSGEIITAISGPQGAAIMSLIGLINIALRWVTVTPIFKGE